MIINIRERDAIVDKAAQWIAREMSGSMTLEERAALAAWSAAAPAHQRALEEFRQTLSSVDDAGAEILEQEFVRELEEIAVESRSPSSQRAYKIAASVAAAALLGVLASFGIHAVNQEAQVAIADYSTRTGEIKTIELKDGSKVELNTASNIEVRFTKSAREVELAAGGGFFDVKKNDAMPFIVKTDNATVTVTGTSFNVSAYGNSTFVQVLSGTVMVAPIRGYTATLTAGRMVEIDADGQIGTVSGFDPSLAFGWRFGKLQFRDTPLPDAVASLNRYFDQPIVLTGGNIDDLQVTGEFNIYDRETAVEALALIFDLEIEDAGSTLRLRNDGDESRN